MAVSAVLPPVVVVALAAVVGKHGAPRFFDSFTELAKTSAVLASNHRAVKALGQRVAALESKVDAGFAFMKKQFSMVERRFVNMERKMDRRFIDLENKMDGRFVDMERKVDARFEEMNKRFMGLEHKIEYRFNHLEQMFTIVLKHVEPK